MNGHIFYWTAIEGYLDPVVGDPTGTPLAFILMTIEALDGASS